jgi:hypothetical protein
MAEQSGRFPWVVWHHGDPGPPIWDIIEELGEERQRQVAQVVIEAQIATLNAQINMLKGIQGALKEG